MNTAALAQIGYGQPTAPDVLVIADDPSAALSDIAAVDARCSAAISVGNAVARLGRPLGSELVMLDIAAGEADEASLAPLFEQLQHGAEAGRFACVVNLPAALIDPAFAALSSPAISLLVEADAMDRRVAVAAALAARRPMRVSDGGTDTGGIRPDDVRDEVARIARRLAALAAEPKALPETARAAANDGRVDAAMVRGIIRARRLREQFFEAALFADPAWDMLLDLTAARLEGSDVAVSSLCIAAAVPPTTALRWIKILTDEGLFVRRADPADKRRIFIALADEAIDAMLCYLAAVQRCGMAV